MIKVIQKKIGKVIHIKIESELLELNPLLNLPIREGKLRSKYLVKRPDINEWYNKHF